MLVTIQTDGHFKITSQTYSCSGGGHCGHTQCTLITT